MVKSRPATSLLHRPSHPLSPGPDPCDLAASQGRHVRPQTRWVSDFQNLPAASWPRMPVPIQRPSTCHVSGTSHVGVRCGAPAPKKLIRPQTSRLSASRSEKQVAAAACPSRRNQHQRLACLLRCPRPGSQRSKSAVDSERPGPPEEMNGRGGGGGGGGEEEMEEDGGGPGCAQGAGNKERVVLMWGYLPGVSPQRSPLLGPVPVRLPPAAAAAAGDGWRDVCGGGCGFAMAISGDVACSLSHCSRAYSLLPFSWSVLRVGSGRSVGVSACAVFAPDCVGIVGGRFWMKDSAEILPTGWC